MSLAKARNTLTRIKLELRNPGLSPERLDAFVDKALAELPTPVDAPGIVRTPAGLPVRRPTLPSLPACRARFVGHLTVIDGGRE